MTQSLLDRFFAEEADDYVLTLLKAELENRTSGSRRFTFNLFDVTMDFDNRTATIDDVLEADSSFSMALDDFEAAISLKGGPA
jgi:hypothetical protein